MFDQNSTERGLSEPHAAPPVQGPPAAPAAARLHLDAARSLWLSRGELRVRVKPVRCFPWSAPGELVSLRDENDREELLVERPGELDASSADALKTALLAAGFVLDIVRVESIEEDY